MFLARCLVALAVLAVPAAASADPAHADAKKAAKDTKTKDKPSRTARVQKSEPRTCLKAPVQIAAGNDSAAVSLLRCDGTPTPLAVAQLSILARPGSAAKPTKPVEALAKTAGADVAPGIRRVDARLLERLEIVADHFRKTGQDLKVQLISGVRPKSVGSYHQTGRALDFRIDGVTNEALVAFCKTLNDTGCGYYPNSLFVHMDVREKGAGHVSWIDISRPGETPKYVSQWPLPKDGPKTPDDPASPADGPNAPSMPAAAISLPTLPMDEPTDGHGSRRRRDGKTYIF